MFTLNVQRSHPNAILPAMPQHPGDCGLDLATHTSVVIPPRSRHAINTNVRIRIPPGYYGRVASRSGLSFKYGIEVGAGTIDSNYRGDIQVMLYNHSADDVVIKAKDRIAQLIIQPYALPAGVVEVERLDADTSRGTAGLGSTG